MFYCVYEEMSEIKNYYYYYYKLGIVCFQFPHGNSFINFSGVLARLRDYSMTMMLANFVFM